MIRVHGFAACFLLFLTLSPRAFADIQVQAGPNRETTPAVAYNPANHEYLAVWTEEILFGGTTITSVKGRRVAESGAMLGDAFTISLFTAYPTIAYNPSVNEYVVAGSSYGNIVGQRISNSGTLLGSQVTLMQGALKGRILCNTITGDYLLVSVVHTPSSPDSTFKWYSCMVSDDLDRIFPPQLLSPLHAICAPATGSPGALAAPGDYPSIADQTDIPVAFAPIQSAETPAGRYLAILQGGVLMLDSEGKPIYSTHDNQSGLWYPGIPFRYGTPPGGVCNIDVAYGAVTSGGITSHSYLIVWSDMFNSWVGTPWKGIWGSHVDATKLVYDAADEVPDGAFPISSVADSSIQIDTVVMQWRPQVSFNPSSQKFLTVWRETPKNLWNVTTRKTHVRGGNGLGAAAGTNMVISDTVGFENPKYPAVAASTTSENALVIWQDSRDSTLTKTDIYGDVVKAGDPVIVPLTGTTVINTSDAGAGSFRQAILNANATAGIDTITFFIPMAGPHTIRPTTPLPPITDPVVIDGYTQPGSAPNGHQMHESDNAVHKIIINGSALSSFGDSAVGLRIWGGNSIVRGLVINDFLACGIVCEEHGGNRVEGNYIGTDASGMAMQACNWGIVVRDVPDNTIGGVTPPARNVVAGYVSGISITGTNASGNHVRGNFIGLDASGTGVIHTTMNGVTISNASDNSIGGLLPAMRNVISIGGTGYNVEIGGSLASRNVVAGNYIGTNAAGSAGLSAQAIGVGLSGSPGNTIGGIHAGSGNVISGNKYGILMASSLCKVQGNVIGTDRTGSKAVANSVYGIAVARSGNTIGGVDASAGNVISGNGCSGVFIMCDSTELQGNLIGTQADGTSPLGNHGHGVLCVNAIRQVTIGGRVQGAANTIAFNDSNGIRLLNSPRQGSSWPVAVRISGNAIYGNRMIGIDLCGGSEDGLGQTANDNGDPDSGPNMLQNSPVISSATGGSFLSLQASLNSTPNTRFDLEVFASPASGSPVPGEGKVFLGFTSVTTNAEGGVRSSMTIGTPVYWDQNITMTATDPAGNTSEFSAPYPVAVGGLTETVTTTADTGAGSLRQAIEIANAYPGPNVIAFDIPGTGLHTIRPASALPIVTDTIYIDGYSQPGSQVNTNTLAEGSNAVLMIELDGSNAGPLTSGLVVASPWSTVRGLIVNRFGAAGIGILGDYNKVLGCFVGTDASGNQRMGNESGVVVSGPTVRTFVGSAGLCEYRNVISGNKTAGILVDCGGGHVYVSGNLIGTSANGKTSLGNTQAGIEYRSGGLLFIGGFTKEGGNVISGSGNDGLNGQPVVRGAGILIGENGQKAVSAGNIIGLNAAGDAALPNFMDGILAHSPCYVYPDSESVPNVISGNAFSAVRFEKHVPGDTAVSVIQGACIGTDITGRTPIGNLCGISVSEGARARIGGGNIIANNRADGIVVYDSGCARITHNSIYANGGLGINLVGGVEDEHGWNTNDPLDGDTGPNGLLNHPELSSVVGGETLFITGSFRGERDAVKTLEFFASPPEAADGDSKTWIGSLDVHTDSIGVVDFGVRISKAVPVGYKITATACGRAPELATSEISKPVIVTVPTGISSGEQVPHETVLMPNYPNPFNPTTSIRYAVASPQVPSVGHVRLVVYDLLGREVAVLVDEQKEPGYYSVTWDAGGLASGVYIVRLVSGRIVMTHKMLLMR